MQCSILVASLSVAVLFQCVSASGYVKKSDITEFASAINGAGRLRYGKRGNWDSLYPESLWETEEESENTNNHNTNLQYAKRAPVPSNLLQKISGAERLRFGRK